MVRIKKKSLSKIPSVVLKNPSVRALSALRIIIYTQTNSIANSEKPGRLFEEDVDCFACFHRQQSLVKLIADWIADWIAD